MFDKLKEVEAKYNQLKEQLYDPEIGSDPTKSMELAKQMSKLEDIYNLYQEYKKYYAQIDEAKTLLDTDTDEDMIELAKSQLKEGEDKIADLEDKLKIALLPQDPNDDKNIYMEIRPAAGGDESGLFAAQLLRMYLRYAENKNWKPEIIEEQSSGIGGIKIAIIRIAGDSVYSRLKFESGVHRVQRVPETESQGRVHTSTVTVAIMPEAEDVDVQIDPNDMEIDTFAASSSGGQHANKNQTGVRIHHKPTGIIVTIGDSKSQMQNKEKALNVLKSKLLQIEEDKHQEQEKELRSNQIGTGGRSEKIRTYNFPQDRLTDHRIKQSWGNLPGIMEGDLDEIIDTLILENQTKLMSATGQ